MSDITDNHEAMNRIRVYAGCNPLGETTPTAYILECKAKKHVTANYNNKSELAIRIATNRAYVNNHDILDKIQKANLLHLQEFIRICEQDGFVDAVVYLMRKRIVK